MTSPFREHPLERAGHLRQQDHAPEERDQPADLIVEHAGNVLLHR
jgi:hypothetical protein